MAFSIFGKLHFSLATKYDKIPHIHQASSLKELNSTQSASLTCFSRHETLDPQSVSQDVW